MMTLTSAEQELVAIGASVGAGCHPCTEHHLKEGSRAGIRREELLQALADAECVKRSAYNELVVASRAHLGESAELPPSCCDDTNIAKEFVSVGSAVGANSVAQLAKHLEQARGVGLTGEQLTEAISIARNVQHHAAEFTAREAVRLGQYQAATKAPIFLTGEPVAVTEENACGADCACRETDTMTPSQNACCGDDLAVPVVAGTTSNKCC